ncbi:MAG: family 16 glycosylhydrolase [Gammaproteobacteria bacterium]|nr:family 16 glycosylhydrolase [Gammaproteobacteria bacterium]
MTGETSPNPDQLSPPRRAPGWRFVLSAFAAGIAVGLLGSAALFCATHHTPIEARAIPSGEHASGTTVSPPTALPAPERLPEATPAPAGSAAPAIPPTPMGEPFVERFDRESISDRWFVSDGWSNGRWMSNDWRKGAVEVGNGQMALNLKPGPKGSDYELMSGEVRTHDFMRYGYFEVRMRVPRDTRAVELTIHENGRSTTKTVTLPFDAAEGFHTYGFDWQPGYVRWYVDGVLAHQEAGPAARNLVRPQQLILNLWGSRELKAWVGPLDTKQGPWRLEFSCVAYAPTYAGSLCD